MGGRTTPEDFEPIGFDGYDEEYWDEFYWWDAVAGDVEDLPPERPAELYRDPESATPVPDPENPGDWMDSFKYVEGFADHYEVRPVLDGIQEVVKKYAALTKINWELPPDPLRPTWDEYFMEGARWAATRSDCERDKVGAVIVDKDNRVRITGYNGAPKGDPGCSSCPRRTSGCAPGSPYDSDIGRCVAVHAEMNAMLWAREDLTDTTMYVTREPCYECSKNISGAGIRRVVWPGGQTERETD